MFIIYGAGNQGRKCLDLLKWRKREHEIYAFCDKRFAEINDIGGEVKILSYEEAKKKKLPFLIAILDSQAANEVLQMMRRDGLEGYLLDDFHKVLGEEQTVFLREECAYHHARNNDTWFHNAEEPASIDVFWNENSIFKKYFNELDLRNVIELACGRGRHVEHYADQARQITLVDILEENMAFCRERFQGMSHIEYYKNNGFNLEKLPDHTFTALFTYDSMVHFEMMDVYEYLKDIYRVLKDGGRALFHHSNYDADYKVDFSSTAHARCFMNKNLFAYLSHRVGYKVLRQDVIDWSGQKNLDCITLVEK